MKTHVRISCPDMLTDEDLTAIVEKLDNEFQSASKRKRLRTAFKAATQSKHVQRFRESLNETKATLTLAMVHQWYAIRYQTEIYLRLTHNSVVQSPTYNISAKFNVSQTMQGRSIVHRARQTLPCPPELKSAPPQQLRKSPSFTGQRFLHPLPAVSGNAARNALMYFEQAVPAQALAGFTVQELMLHAISQTAIATFETSSLEIFAQDGYMMDQCGQIRSKTFVYSDRVRYRVRHQASSFRTALGCVWVRKTIISQTDEFSKESEKSQTVTSIVFYPTKCLQMMGVRNGLEAITASAGRSWLYNCRITVTRAVPEDAMIFELCLAGETRAVQMLLEKGQGSVVDTSPKGWKPLHVRSRIPFGPRERFRLMKI